MARAVTVGDFGKALVQADDVAVGASREVAVGEEVRDKALVAPVERELLRQPPELGLGRARAVVRDEPRQSLLSDATQVPCPVEVVAACRPTTGALA